MGEVACEGGPDEARPASHQHPQPLSRRALLHLILILKFLSCSLLSYDQCGLVVLRVAECVCVCVCVLRTPDDTAVCACAFVFVRTR
jgi:hypothetical protein